MPVLKQCLLTWSRVMVVCRKREWKGKRRSDEMLQNVAKCTVVMLKFWQGIDSDTGWKIYWFLLNNAVCTSLLNAEPGDSITALCAAELHLKQSVLSDRHCVEMILTFWQSHTASYSHCSITLWNYECFRYLKVLPMWVIGLAQGLYLRRNCQAGTKWR